MRDCDTLKVSLSHRSRMGEVARHCDIVRDLDSNLFLYHQQHVVPIPKSKRLATMFPFFCSARIPLAIPQSHGESLLQRRQGNVVFILSSLVLLWSSWLHRRRTLTLGDSSQTPPLEALLKSLEFHFWNKTDYSFPGTALCHMVSEELQLTVTANFRRPLLAGRRVCGVPSGSSMRWAHAGPQANQR